METLMGLVGREVRFLYPKGEEKELRAVKVERVFQNRFQKWVINGLDLIENEYRSFSVEKCGSWEFVMA